MKQANQARQNQFGETRKKQKQERAKRRTILQEEQAKPALDIVWKNNSFYFVMTQNKKPRWFKISDDVDFEVKMEELRELPKYKAICDDLTHKYHFNREKEKKLDELKAEIDLESMNERQKNRVMKKLDKLSEKAVNSVVKVQQANSSLTELELNQIMNDLFGTK
jgi:hypothetical protein